MARSTALKNALATAYVASAGKASLHAADPGTTGANEVSTTPRVSITWNSVTGGTVTSNTVTFSIASTVTCTHIGIWTTGGTFLEGILNNVTLAAGTYTVTLEYIEP